MAAGTGYAGVGFNSFAMTFDAGQIGKGDIIFAGSEDYSSFGVSHPLRLLYEVIDRNTLAKFMSSHESGKGLWYDRPYINLDSKKVLAGVAWEKTTLEEATKVYPTKF